MTEEDKILLIERARLLATEPGLNDEDKEFTEVISFSLAGEMYAIASSFVREVHPLKSFTTLPGTPRFVLGIINIRGQILSIVNLKHFFHLPEEGLGELNKVIIVNNETMEFGILADVVHGTEKIDLNTLQPPLPNINGLGAEFLLGVTPGSCILLDIQRILRDQSIIVDTEVN